MIKNIITLSQAQLIFNKTEGQFCEMKAKEILPRKLTKTLSAFANADGGEIFLGIATTDDSFTWDGFINEEAANAHIQIIEEKFPLGSTVRCEFLECANLNGLVLHIEIDKTTDIKTSSDEVPYIRRGAQNLPVDTPEKIERLRLDKGITSFEDQTLNTELEDITNSQAAIEFMLEVVPSAEPEAWLKKQKVINTDKPTVAGIILYADEPQTVLPKSAIKIYRYKTSDDTGTRATLAFDPVSIEGNAYKIIYEAVAKVKEITEQIPVLGESGMEKITYPIVALHEVITNAVIHRDYSINDDIHVRIFDNRIEVQSPGILPGHITIMNILDERAARNPKIVRLLNKFKNPPNKDVGEGLNTTFEAMRSLKLKDPIVEQRDNRVIVTLRHEKLGTPEEIIIEYLQSNKEINNSKVREICFIGSENTVKRILQKMVNSGILDRIPDRPLNKTGYIKGNNFPKT